MADERAALETFLRSIDDSLVAFVDCLTTAGYGTKKRLENASREGLLTVSGLRQGDVDLIIGHFSRGASAADQELHARMAMYDARMARYEQQQSTVQQSYRKLEVQLSRRSNTTQLELQLGEVYYNSAVVCTTLPGLPDPNIKKLEDGCNDLIKQWWEANKLPEALRTGIGRSSSSSTPLVIRLTDVVPDKPRESDHMQPRVMEMLHAVSRAVGSPQELVDTHIRNFLKQPTALIDCCGLATELVEWTQLVVPWEFKLQRAQVVSLLGQLIDRCMQLFHHQPQRQRAYAVGIMLDAVEVFTIMRVDGGLNVSRTGLHSLTIDSRSPGLQLVASILQASLEQLGFCSPTIPASTQLGAYTIRNSVLIQEGSAPPSEQPGSFVFRVTVDGLEEPAILKLNHTGHEEMMLKRLSGVPHVVQLVASGELMLEGRPWRAILLQPFGRLLERSDPPMLIARVASDVAQAISDCASKDIAHRDVTAGNFVEYEHRGYLCDFTAAKVVHDWTQLPSPTGRPTAISGTLEYAAVSVLEGGPHTESSMYEGLFYSLLSTCCGGKVPGPRAYKASDFAVGRRGVMMKEPPIDMWGAPEDIAALLRALHALFWPQPLPGAFMYRTDVTVEEVRNVCESFIAEISA